MYNKYLKYSEGYSVAILIAVVIFSIILLSATAYSYDGCKDTINSGDICEVITPVIECLNYDLYYPNKTSAILSGNMTQIGLTGVYNFTFNQTTSGVYTFLLCSNHTSEITVGITDSSLISSINSSLSGEINVLNNNLISINNTLYTKIGSVNSSLYANINLVNTNIISINNTLYAKVDAINSSIISQLNKYSSNSTFLGDSIWSYPSRTITSATNVTINTTLVAQDVWNYNISTITSNTNTAGGFIRLIHTIVSWIERLI